MLIMLSGAYQADPIHTMHPRLRSQLFEMWRSKVSPTVLPGEINDMWDAVCQTWNNTGNMFALNLASLMKSLGYGGSG